MSLYIKILIYLFDNFPGLSVVCHGLHGPVDGIHLLHCVGLWHDHDPGGHGHIHGHDQGRGKGRARGRSQVCRGNSEQCKPEILKI